MEKHKEYHVLAWMEVGPSPTNHTSFVTPTRIWSSPETFQVKTRSIEVLSTMADSPWEALKRKNPLTLSAEELQKVSEQALSQESIAGGLHLGKC